MTHFLARITRIARIPGLIVKVYFEGLNYDA